MQFVYPVYGECEFSALYECNGYKTFNDSFYPIQDLDGSLTKEFVDVCKEKYQSIGIAAWKDRFCERNHRKPSFLDVGCGRGQQLLVFDELGFDVTGIDMSPIQVDWIKQRSNFPVITASWEDFPSDRRFDCVLASHVIEHVSAPVLFMRKLLSLLEPDGLLLIETPVIFDHGSSQEKYCDIYHTLFFDHFTLTLLAAHVGLRLMNSVNVNFLEGRGTYCIHVLASFTRDSELDLASIDPLYIRSLRASYDTTLRDFEKWGRAYLDQNCPGLVKRIRDYWMRHGSVATCRAILDRAKSKIVGSGFAF
jgi:2-polyprenyl-3-methyl-5-hydroxy-6-metoxy-1,4-benzoquinol methylase